MQLVALLQQFVAHSIIHTYVHMYTKFSFVQFNTSPPSVGGFFPTRLHMKVCACICVGVCSLTYIHSHSLQMTPISGFAFALVSMQQQLALLLEESACWRVRVCASVCVCMFRLIACCRLYSLSVLVNGCGSFGTRCLAGVLKQQVCLCWSHCRATVSSWWLIHQR